MIMLIHKILQIWFKIPDKIRFILVGGFNTVVSYFLFWLFYRICALYYNEAVTIQWLISVNISIFTMRYFVFRHTKNLWKEYIKGFKTYLILLLVNISWLTITDIIFHQNPLISQLIYIIISSAITYLLHKYYSFKV